MSLRSKCSCWLGERWEVKLSFYFMLHWLKNIGRFLCFCSPWNERIQLLHRRADEIWKMSVEKHHCVIHSKNPLLCVNLKGSNLSKNRLALVGILPAFALTSPAWWCNEVLTMDCLVNCKIKITGRLLAEKAGKELMTEGKQTLVCEQITDQFHESNNKPVEK